MLCPSKPLLLGVLFTFSVLLTPVLLASMPLLVLFVSRQSRRIEKASVNKVSKNKLFASCAQDLILKGASLRLLHNVRYACEIIRMEGLNLRLAFRALKKANLWTVRGVGYLDRLSSIIVLVVGAIFVRRGVATIGAIFAFYTAARKLSESIDRMVRCVRALQEASPALGSVWQIAQTNQMEYPEARVKPRKNDFDLKDVRFAYPPNDALLSDRPCGGAVLCSHRHKQSRLHLSVLFKLFTTGDKKKKTPYGASISRRLN